MLFSLYNDKGELVTDKSGYDLVHNCSNMLKGGFKISFPYCRIKDNDDDWFERMGDKSVEDVIVMIFALMNEVEERMLNKRDYGVYHTVKDAKKFLSLLVKLRIAEDLEKKREEQEQKNEPKGNAYSGKVIFRVKDEDDEGLMKIVYDFVCKMSEEWRKTRFLCGNDGVEYRLTDKGEIEVEYEDRTFVGGDAEFTWETRIKETEDALKAFDVEFEKEELGPYFKEESKPKEREYVRLNLREDIEKYGGSKSKNFGVAIKDEHIGVGPHFKEEESKPKEKNCVGEEKKFGGPKDITEERSYIEVGIDKEDGLKESIDEAIEFKNKQESLKFIYKVEDFMLVDDRLLEDLCMKICYTFNSEELKCFDNGIVDYTLREEEGEIEVGYIIFDKSKHDSEIKRTFYTMCDMIEKNFDELGFKYRRILSL